jgi:glutathione S-transferase
MRLLYHFPLSPFSRKIRIVLAEKKLEFELEEEKAWERRSTFLALNPAGDVPVLIEPDGEALADSQAIAEYLEELEPEPPLLGLDARERAEIRRLINWFDRKFCHEVTDNLVGEKIMSRLVHKTGPDSRAIRAGHANIAIHLDYIGFLTERRNWLAGEHLSLADITAAAHLSCIDYLGDVPWDDYEDAKNWYARIKSRPSFRALLGDQVPGMPPAKAYADLDF